MKIAKTSKGITLIALVITIVVLLILAGVSIATLTGENGMIAKANQAKEASKKAELRERIQLAVIASRANTTGEIDKEVLHDELAKIEGIGDLPDKDANFPWEVTAGGYTIKITEDGDVNIQGDATEPTTPSEIALTGITINPESAELEIGGTIQIEVTKEPSNTTEKVIYESNAENVATVDESGKVTAKAEGTAIITVKGEKTTSVSKTFTVTVIKPGVPDSTGLFTKTSTINGAVASANNPTIPAGFKPMDVTTGQTPATWGEGTNAPSEQSVKNGLVITDGTSEFVWIPVENINEMAREIDGTNDDNGNKKYRGVLYKFNSDKTQNSERAWSTDSTSNREPANLDKKYDNADNITGWTSTLYQEEYDKMVKQVEKYHGFYVGRYEMSLNSEGEAQSKGEVTSANASESKNKYWYGLYTKAKTYAPDTQENTKSVVSSMIWGSQYDAMMRWMQDNGVDVTETPTDTPSSTLQYAERNKRNKTGGENNKDVINNVYDILGNRWEWTQEATVTRSRVLRGGYYGIALSPSDRSSGSPSNVDADFGSRFTFYIK